MKRLRSVRGPTWFWLGLIVVLGVSYVWGAGAIYDPMLGRMRSDQAGTLWMTTGESVTVVGGAIAVRPGMWKVEGEGGAADNIDIITGGRAGDMLFLRPATAGHTLTLRHNVAGGGNVTTPGAADYPMPDLSYVQLYHNGESWVSVTVAVPGGAGIGDMLKATYDVADNGVVDAVDTINGATGGTVSTPVIIESSVTLGVNGKSGSVVLYSEQGGTDYAWTLTPNGAMTASFTESMAAALPGGLAFDKCDATGMHTWDTSTYLLDTGDTSTGNYTHTGQWAFESPLALTLGASTTVTGAMGLHSAGGAAYMGILTETTLSANRTYSLPDVTTTLLGTATGSLTPAYMLIGDAAGTGVAVATVPTTMESSLTIDQPGTNVDSPKLILSADRLGVAQPYSFQYKYDVAYPYLKTIGTTPAGVEWVGYTQTESSITFGDTNYGEYSINFSLNSEILAKVLKYETTTKTLSCMRTLACESPLAASFGKDAATNTAGKIRFWSAGAVDYWTDLIAGTNTQNITFTLPVDDGAANQFLQTDGSGVLSWATVDTTGLVPYTGASSDVDLGAQTLTADFLVLDDDRAIGWNSTATGVRLHSDAATYTEDGPLGTRDLRTTHSFGIPTYASDSTAVTYTDAANVYIAGVPAAGANMTITNPWALYIAAGASRFDGVTVAGTASCESALAASFGKSTVDAGRVGFHSAGGAAYVGLLEETTLSANRTRYLPDKDGILAVTSDLLSDGQLSFSFDGGGGAVTAGTYYNAAVRLPYDITLTSWEMVSPETGTCALVIYKTTIDTWPALTSIMGAQTMAMTACETAVDMDISNWGETMLAAGTYLVPAVASATETGIIPTLFFSRR